VAWVHGHFGAPEQEANGQSTVDSAVEA
jgi:hypothetical protein